MINLIRTKYVHAKTTSDINIIEYLYNKVEYIKI